MPKITLHSTRFLAAMGAVSLALTGEVKLALFGGFLLFFLLGLKIEAMPRLSSFFGKAQAPLALLAFAAAIFDFFKISQSFLIAVAHFLISLQALRLLSLVKVRDNVGSAILSSLMVLSSATLATEWTFFLSLMVFLPALIWTLILINLSHEHSVSDSSIFGKDNFTNERTPAWLGLLPSVRLSTAIAFGVTVIFCAFIFAIFPRFSFRGFRGQFLQPVHKTGFTSQIDLNKSGRIFEDASIVMRVEMDPKDRNIWPGYLRGSTLDSFDGEIWRKSEIRRKQVFRRLLGPIELPFNGVLHGRSLRQHIYLESLDTSVLFAAPWPVKLNIERPFLFWGEDFSISRRQGDTWRAHYTVESVAGTSLPSFPGAGGQLSLLTALPKNLNLEIGRLARDIVSASQDNRAHAQTIEKFLRENFTYSLDIPKISKGGALEQFLFQTRRGHCEYFASAMCVMLRTLKVPARVVTGFRANEWNSRGNYYLVRMKDSHAWVEAYIQNYGWMSFDPSPRTAEEDRNSGALNQNLTELLDYLNLQWNRYILSYDMERQVEIVRSFNTRSQEITLKLNRWSLSWGKLFSWGGKPSSSAKGKVPQGYLWSVLFMMLFSIGFFVSIYLLISAQRKKKERVWFYKRLLDMLEKKGGPKPSSLTISEFARKLKSDFEGRQSAIDFLINEYYRLRFNPRRDIAPPDKKAILSALNS